LIAATITPFILRAFRLLLLSFFADALPYYAPRYLLPLLLDAIIY